MKPKTDIATQILCLVFVPDALKTVTIRDYRVLVGLTGAGVWSSFVRRQAMSFPCLWQFCLALATDQNTVGSSSIYTVFMMFMMVLFSIFYFPCEN